MHIHDSTSHWLIGRAWVNGLIWLHFLCRPWMARSAEWIMKNVAAQIQSTAIRLHRLTHFSGFGKICLNFSPFLIFSFFYQAQGARRLGNLCKIQHVMTSPARAQSWINCPGFWQRRHLCQQAVRRLGGFTSPKTICTWSITVKIRLVNHGRCSPELAHRLPWGKQMWGRRGVPSLNVPIRALTGKWAILSVQD